jgi:hypothetical protein
METKICTKCGEEKDVSEFYTDMNICKPCHLNKRYRTIQKSEKKYFSLKEWQRRNKKISEQLTVNEIKIRKNEFIKNLASSKICRFCNQKKNNIEFPITFVRKRNNFVVFGTCIECTNQEKRNYYIDHKDQIKIKNKEYLKTHPCVEKKIKESQRNRMKEYYANQQFRDHLNVYLKKFRKEHPEGQNKNNRKKVDEIHDSYIANHFYIPTLILRKKHPYFIKAYREQIKLKRLIKTKKNENNETS